MDWHHALLFSLALLVAVCALPVFGRLARRSGWVDKPNERKQHEGDVPLTGGIAVLLAVAAASLVSRLDWPVYAIGLAAGLLLCFLSGVWDDRRPLRARYRFAAQLAAGVCAVVGGQTFVRDLGTTFGPFSFGLWYFAIPMTVVALAGLVNAFNMADGADGLCGGYAAIALSGLLGCAALVQARDPQSAALAELAPIVLPFLGALLGFLLFNLRHPLRGRAAVFLGDGGSTALGFLVGWLAVRLASGFGVDGMPPAVAVALVALPLADLFSCMIRRVREGVTPMTADRRHMHHLLMTHGLSVGQAVATLHGIALLLAAAAIGAWQMGVPPWAIFWSVIGLFVAYNRYAIRFWAALGSQRGVGREPAPLPGGGKRDGLEAPPAVGAFTSPASPASLASPAVSALPTPPEPALPALRSAHASASAVVARTGEEAVVGATFMARTGRDER